MKPLKVLMLDLKSYYPSPPYQLGLMVAYAQTIAQVKEGIEFVFSEHAREVPPAKIAQEVYEAQADMIAISDYAWNHKKLCDTLDILISYDKPLPRILIGGPNCTGKLGENMLKKYSVVSALVEGEGEPAFLDICKSLVTNPSADPFVQSRNCVFRGKNGSIEKPDIGHRIGSLDEIPSPYLTSVLPPSPSPIFYETNRGCPYRCAFCYWGNGNSKVYRMSIERVKEEMEFFAKHRVRAFWLADANFGIFPSDSDIAEAMVEINEKYNHPFSSVGVNWAKNSSDRVLEIAEIFRKGNIACSTTIALQTVSAKAEEYSKRYSMNPVKFMNLVRNANAKNIDTYTDIILGLPGETLEEFIRGVSIVSTTSVPSIKIHQLVLIPATEFFDKKEELGLLTNEDVETQVIPESEKSDYYDSTVVGHPLMSIDDMVIGRYIMGINHILHNHNLGHVVNQYLHRYGISFEDVYLFMVRILQGKHEAFNENNFSTFIDDLRKSFKFYTNKFGIDDNKFVTDLSFMLWFTNDEDGFRVYNDKILQQFTQEFYKALSIEHGFCQTAEDEALLRCMVDYNFLIAPKPSWVPEKEYTFEYDVDQIWNDISKTVLDTTDFLSTEKISKSEKENTWAKLPELIQGRVKNLLSESYLSRMHKTTVYKVHNPWGIPPSRKNIDWVVNNKSKHCTVETIKSSTLTYESVV